MFKQPIRFLALCFSTLLLCTGAVAQEGVLKASSEKTEQIESWLRYATVAKTGAGKKTVFVFCNIECPRCARFSAMVEALPENVQKEFEFRWILSRARDNGLLYSLENPTSSIFETFREQKPKPIIDEQGLMMGITYNAVIGGQVAELFPRYSDGSLNYTPVFVFKTDDGFEKRSLESLEGQPMEKIFSQAQHVEGKELIPIVKQVFTKFEKQQDRYFTVTEAAQLRLLPADDSPVVSILDAGFTTSPIGEDEDWISVEMQSGIPFAFVKKTQGKFE